MELEKKQLRTISDALREMPIIWSKTSTLYHSQPIKILTITIEMKIFKTMSVGEKYLVTDGTQTEENIDKLLKLRQRAWKHDYSQAHYHSLKKETM